MRKLGLEKSDVTCPRKCFHKELGTARPMFHYLTLRPQWQGLSTMRSQLFTVLGRPKSIPSQKNVMDIVNIVYHFGQIKMKWNTLK